jgi:hypothetical protein
MSNRKKLAALMGCVASLSSLVIACDKKAPQPPLNPKNTDQDTNDREALAEFLNKDTKSPTSGALPQGHPPIGGASVLPAKDDALPPGHPPMGGGPVSPPSGPELKYEVPTEWQPMPVKSPLRKAQFQMPGATPAEDGEMIVYFFGAGQGGTTEANLARWRGFFMTPEGKAVPDDSVRSEHFAVGNLKVTTLDIAGLYADTTMSPNVKPSTEIKRLLGAIVETPGGNWFFKGIGPPATMEHHRERFGEMLRTTKQ